MANYDTAFNTPAAASFVFGQEGKFSFGGTWAAGASWTAQFTSTVAGDFTLGEGVFISTPTFGTVFKTRAFLAMGTRFVFSSNTDPTRYEEQDPGAGYIDFGAQGGTQDTVTAFGTFLDNLVVFGTKNTQIWSVSADPASFALFQYLKDTGTVAPYSIQGIGDLDVLYLDRNGIRSIRAKQDTRNAYVSDVGTPIDALLREAIRTSDETLACSIIEPDTKQYWLHLNGDIYVLSQYPISKIQAWSIFKPTAEVALSAASNYNGAGQLSYTGTLVIGGYYYWTKGANESRLVYNGGTELTESGGFTATTTSATAYGIPSAAYTGTLVRVDTSINPSRFISHNGQVYFRAADHKVYYYGGSDKNTYDHCRATVELPWLDFGSPTMAKQIQGFDAAFSGQWTFSMSCNPRTTAYTTVTTRGSLTSPSTVADSTFDVGRFPFSAHGTHLKIKAVSGISAVAARLGKIAVVYANAETK